MEIEMKSEHAEMSLPLPVKKKRNLPGMPDPDAEVIALSPTSLLATNRFVCEICNKGFQREQNLQLHRRGHNLPWNLRQRMDKEVRKRVYLCPETTCIHHDASRALGDLTGVKKHFCRKHGVKKFECERCSKKYAVQCDWKAHMKTCGTKEYRCDCGTLFSRRDSFITHRAFCGALAQESAQAKALAMFTDSAGEDLKVQMLAPPKAAPVIRSPSPPPSLTPSTGVLSPVLSIQSSAELPEKPTAPPGTSAFPAMSTVTATSSSSTSAGNIPGNGGVLICKMFNAASTSAEPSQQPTAAAASFSANAMLHTMAGSDLVPLSLSSSSFYLSNGSSSVYSAALELEHPHRYYASSPQPAALSATALLQKATQMGATSSNSSFLRGLGLAMTCSPESAAAASNWGNGHEQLENDALAFGLGLGRLPSSSTSSSSGNLNELMMNSSTLFGEKPATLDFLGLGMGAGGASSGGFSAFLRSISDGLDIAAADSFVDATSGAGERWNYPSDDRN